MSPWALGVFVSLAVTHSYLREALYLAGRNVFTESTHEQRTCVWLGTWQEMLSSPGGSGKRESDRFIYRTEMVFVFISRAIIDEYFKSFSVVSSSLKWTARVSLSGTKMFQERLGQYHGKLPTPKKEGHLESRFLFETFTGSGGLCLCHGR